MPASADRRTTLVDTSVAVALVVADHEHHDAVSSALRSRRLGLAGHATFETYSVLTRMPPPARRTAPTVARILAAGFPGTRHLGAAAAAKLTAELGALGVAGGTVYDALVGACAREHGLVLATRDRRALDVYRALDVRVEVLA